MTKIMIFYTRWFFSFVKYTYIISKNGFIRQKVHLSSKIF